jgi:hypothetical protein
MKNESANVIPPGPRPQRQTAREWMKQTGEFDTELFAACGEEMYSEIMAAMSEFGEYVESFFPMAAPSAVPPQIEALPMVDQSDRAWPCPECAKRNNPACLHKYHTESSLGMEQVAREAAKEIARLATATHEGCQTINILRDNIERLGAEVVLESLRRSGAPETMPTISSGMAKYESLTGPSPATAPAQPEPKTVDEMIEATVVGKWMEDIDYIQANLYRNILLETRKALCSLWSRMESYAIARPGAHNGQGWAQDAFVMLAGLKEAVEWELAPAIMKEIRRLVDTFPAPPDGQGAKS